MAKKITMDNGEVYILVKEEEMDIPSASEVMRHLLNGGWVEDRDYSNASYFARLTSQGNFEKCFKRDDETVPPKGWEMKYGLNFVDYEMKDWKLIKPLKF